MRMPVIVCDDNSSVRFKEDFLNKWSVYAMLDKFAGSGVVLKKPLTFSPDPHGVFFRYSDVINSADYINSISSNALEL